MPYSGSNFSIPNSFTPNTVILASKMNENFTDIAANGLSAVLQKDGAGQMTGQLKADDGLVTAPGITFGNDPDNGFYRIGTNRFGLALAGALVLDFANGGIVRNRRALNAAGTIVAGDHSGIVEVTTGTFSLAFTAAATLGAGFWCLIANTGTGVVTLNPDGAELIDGAATIGLLAGQAALVFCTGSAFETIRLGDATGPASSTDGGFAKFNGTTGKLLKDSAATVAVADGGTGATTAANARTNLGLPPARAYAEYAGTDAITSVIPIDDSKPQIGEGFEILSAAITLKQATSRVRLRFQGFGQAFSGGDDFSNWTAALFIAGTADALSATVGPVDMTDEDVDMTFPAVLEFEHAPGSVGPHTYSIRVGPATSTNRTLRMNSANGTRVFGGAAISTLVVEEIFV